MSDAFSAVPSIAWPLGLCFLHPASAKVKGGLSSLQRTSSLLLQEPRTFLRPVGSFLTTEVSASGKETHQLWRMTLILSRPFFMKGFSSRPFMARTTQQSTHKGMPKRLAGLCANAVTRQQAQDSHTRKAPESRHTGQLRRC